MLVVADRVREYTNFTGTSNIELQGSSSTFKTFASVCQELDTVYYCVVHNSFDEWEIGLGEFTNNTIRRIHVLSSSTESVVDFSAGAKDVFLTQPSNVLAVATYLPTNTFLGRQASGYGVPQQLSVTDVKQILNLSSSDISNLISATTNNRATLDNGVYVPELTVNLTDVYNTAKQ